MKTATRPGAQAVRMRSSGAIGFDDLADFGGNGIDDRVYRGLGAVGIAPANGVAQVAVHRKGGKAKGISVERRVFRPFERVVEMHQKLPEIGRASCRERV